ncbi:MAG: CHAT domain-containing protein, partial [Acidobacteriota bacterium]
MNCRTEKPVIFLAFANDQQDGNNYLRQLPIEHNELRQALNQLRIRELCEIVERANVGFDQVVEIFQEYRNRIVIFHFGGHANSYQLLFESIDGQTKAVPARRLAELCHNQSGLKLIFLNGCATRQQAEELLNTNVPAVIATSQAIDDQVARMFASCFYRGFANGASIRTAFDEAATMVLAEKGEQYREFYFSGVKSINERFPWELFLKRGRETVAQWSLSDACNDPLFGLPDISSVDLPSQPYRYLKRFESSDAELFFGRGQQINLLYRQITASQGDPILLFYGQSGVGKSSLLEAGLLPRLEISHKIYCLRCDQEKELLPILEATLLSSSSVSINTAWQKIEIAEGRPLTIIIDQVEEIFMRQPQQEQELNDFFNALKTVYANPDQRPQGKLILSFRKEWLPEVESWLQKTSLPVTKFFLERLDRNGIIEVIKGLTNSERLRNKYRLTIKDDELPTSIADDLLNDRESALAPTLQILLTKMWNEAVSKNNSRPCFDLTLYYSLKEQGILLKDFLEQQLEVLRNYNSEVVNSGLILDLLTYYTTPLGTAAQHSETEVKNQYRYCQEVIEPLLAKCKDLYLLVDASKDQRDKAILSETRLAHDTLAPLVREKFENSDRPGQRARRILENLSQDWQNGKQGITLSERDLDLVKQGAKGMRAWKQAEERLIVASKQACQRRVRNRRLLNMIGGTFLLLVIISILVAWQQWQERRERQWELYEEQGRQQLLTGDMARALVSFNKVYQQCKDKASLRFLLAQAKRSYYSKMFQVMAHNNIINNVSFSPDNRLIVTASQDNHACIWEVATGRQLFKLSGHKGNVLSASFSNDSHRIVTASEDGIAKVWDTFTGKQLTSLEGHTDKLLSACFSPSGQLVVTASHDHTAKVWDTNNGKLIATLKHNDTVYSATFNPDGLRIITASGDHTAKVWDTTGEILFTIDKHSDAVKYAGYSPDGHYIITASSDRTAILLDSNNSDRETLLSFHTKGLRSAFFSPDGKYIATLGEDSTVKIWDKRGDILTTIESKESIIISAEFSPDGLRIITTHSDNTAK